MYVSNTKYESSTPVVGRALDLWMDVYYAHKADDAELDRAAFHDQMIWFSEFVYLGADALDGVYDLRDHFVEEENYRSVAIVEACIAYAAAARDHVDYAGTVGARARQYLGFHYGIRHASQERKATHASKEFLDRMRAGASEGGRRSGMTRRKQSRVPTPEALADERGLLISLGRAPRNVASILAQRYGCTSEHIRSILKKAK